MKLLLDEMFSPAILAVLRSRGLVFVPANVSRSKAATGQLVAALEGKLAEYAGEENLANGETWI